MTSNNRYPEDDNPENRYHKENTRNRSDRNASAAARQANRERQRRSADDTETSYEEEAARRKAMREMREIRRKERQLDMVKKGLLAVIIILAIVLLVMVAGLFKTKKTDSSTSSRSDRQKTTAESSAEDTSSPSGTDEEPETAGSSATSAVSTEASQTSVSSAPEVVTGPPVYTVSPEQLYSDVAYMVRVSDGFTVMDKSSTLPVYPASMTKLMTALLVVENIPDLNTQLTVTWEIVDRMYAQEASLAGFEGGESVPVIDLLYGLLLPSGAEASELLAESIGGSVDGFVAMMNNRAAELGMNDTNFCNPTGLHADAHISTCRDIAILLRKVLENETLKNILSTPSYVCTPTDQHPDGLSFANTMLHNMSGNVMKNGAVIMGGKTGTTDEAGKCLASFGMYKDDEYILVTAAAWEYGEYGFPNLEDAQAVYGGLTF